MTIKQEQGLKNRIKGRAFEMQVRRLLEKHGFVVSRWTNNVFFEFPDNDVKIKIAPARHVMARSLKFRTINTGFPDFIFYSHTPQANSPVIHEERFAVMACEVKTNRYLNPEERRKIRHYLK